MRHDMVFKKHPNNLYSACMKAGVKRGKISLNLKGREGRTQGGREQQPRERDEFYKLSLEAFL